MRWGSTTLHAQHSWNSILSYSYQKTWSRPQFERQPLTHGWNCGCPLGWTPVTCTSKEDVNPKSFPIGKISWDGTEIFVTSFECLKMYCQFQHNLHQKIRRDATCLVDDGSLGWGGLLQVHTPWAVPCTRLHCYLSKPGWLVDGTWSLTSLYTGLSGKAQAPLSSSLSSWATPWKRGAAVERKCQFTHSFYWQLYSLETTEPRAECQTAEGIYFSAWWLLPSHLGLPICAAHSFGHKRTRTGI